MSDMQDAAVEKIMEKFFNYVIVTATWFTNYAERKGAPAETIADLRSKLKELKDEVQGHE